MKQTSKQFIYKTRIKWHGEKKGALTSSEKPDIAVAAPPEFRGHAGIWTPEELFVASVNSCIMTTFLHYAEKKNVEFLSYESEAEGTLERVGNDFMFSKIKVMPEVVIADTSRIEDIKKLLELSEKSCLISNSIKSNVQVIPVVKAGK